MESIFGFVRTLTWCCWYSLINYCKGTRDYLVPSVWGPVSKGEDPYAPAGGGCNCTAM